MRLMRLLCLTPWAIALPRTTLTPCISLIPCLSLSCYIGALFPVPTRVVGGGARGQAGRPQVGGRRGQSARRQTHL